mmetsp:Transcript_4285/g.5591  ORF Transcript_4285/g.5591 Transcript_4285/m.5591 type:complete len:348 (+) Transcript_4285:66-1109(+)|eukprot:5625431-Ditylum_brightwellii.AAC.1
MHLVCQVFLPLLLLLLTKTAKCSSGKSSNTYQGSHMSKSNAQSDDLGAKASAPPTIAYQKRHKDLLLGLNELELSRKRSLCGDDDNDDSRKQDFESQLPSVPKKLQQYANDHSLKRWECEMELQREIEELPRSIMAGAPDEANLLCLLLEMMDATTVIEVGVFRGITTLTLALCLKRMNQKASSIPPGDDIQRRRRIIGLDVSEEYVTTGEKYWIKAGVDDIIDFRVGDAKNSLKMMLEEEDFGENSVDMCFIDADKVSYDDYYEKCLRLTKKGGLIVVDNTLWGGRVLTPDSMLTSAAANNEDNGKYRFEDTIAIKALNKKIFNDTRVERVCFLTIADGVTICRKK